MTPNNELYVERIPGESIGDFFRRYRSKTNASPTRATFVRCYSPFVVFYTGTQWNHHHKWLIENIRAEHYIWYGDHFFFTNEEDAILFKLACSS